MPLFSLIIDLRYTGLRIHRDQLRIRKKRAPQGGRKTDCHMAKQQKRLVSMPRDKNGQRLESISFSVSKSRKNEFENICLCA